MPWIWKYTVGLEDAVIYFRSDNCAGQFESGRHFRFILGMEQIRKYKRNPADLVAFRGQALEGHERLGVRQAEMAPFLPGDVTYKREPDMDANQ